MAGRKPKPSNLKLLHGNPGHRPMPENEPKPKRADLEPPAALSERAKKQFSVVAIQLDEAGILTELDTHALCLYCEAYAKWAEATNALQKTGMLIKTPQGFPVQNPLIGIANKAFDQMIKILSEFGMTPSSRSRIKVNEESSLDPLEKLLNRK